MCRNKKKEILSNTGNLFGVWSKFGSKRTISLLVVCLLALSPLLAIPGKAGLFQRTTLTSQDSSQSQSLENLTNLNESQKIQSQIYEESLLKEKSILTSVSAKLDVVDSQMAYQMDLTEILKDSAALTLKVNENLTLDNVALSKDNAEKDGIIEGLKGDKVKKIFDVGGTYNTIEGWGVSADVGLKRGIFTTKIGAEVALGDLLNPVALANLDTYTFRASVGLQW